MENSNSEWREYQKLVLSELQRLNDVVISLDQKIQTNVYGEISKLRVKIAMLEVKSGIYGSVGGLIATISVIAIQYLRK